MELGKVQQLQEKIPLPVKTNLLVQQSRGHFPPGLAPVVVEPEEERVLEWKWEADKGQAGEGMGADAGDTIASVKTAAGKSTTAAGGSAQRR